MDRILPTERTPEDDKVSRTYLNASSLLLSETNRSDALAANAPWEPGKALNEFVQDLSTIARNTDQVVDNLYLGIKSELRDHPYRLLATTAQSSAVSAAAAVLLKEAGPLAVKASVLIGMAVLSSIGRNALKDIATSIKSINDVDASPQAILDARNRIQSYGAGLADISAGIAGGAIAIGGIGVLNRFNFLKSFPENTAKELSPLGKFIYRDVPPTWSQINSAFSAPGFSGSVVVASLASTGAYFDSRASINR